MASEYATIHIKRKTQNRVTDYCEAFNLTRDELINWLLDETAGVYKKALQDKLEKIGV